jgi:type I restriction enzyme M protein
VQTDRTLNKLDPAVLETLIGKLRGSIGLSSVVKKDLTQAVAAAAFAAGGLKPPRMKALWNALSVRDPDAPIVTDTDGNPEPDPELRDQENVPLPEGVANRYEQNVTDRLAGPVYVDAVEQHLEREVHPYVPDAWIDHSKTRIGYEIPVTRHFYKYVPPRLLAEIDAEIKHLESEIQGLLRQVTE